jgi:integrase
LRNMVAFLKGETMPEPEKAWQPLKSIKRSFRTSAKRAEIATPSRFHDIRARYITEVAKGASGAITQAAARHADFKTTQRYINVGSDEVSAAVSRVSHKARPSLRLVKG